jgi:hypothetical protein
MAHLVSKTVEQSWKIRCDNEDVAGKVFGRLTAVRRDHREILTFSDGKISRPEFWYCDCACGGHAIVRKSHLGKQVKSCGCLNAPDKLEGKRFGRLTCIRIAKSYIPGKIKWLARCDCGREIEVEANSLKRGNTQSCGCLRHENSGQDAVLEGCEAGFRAIYRSCRRGATKRGLSWNLDIEEARGLLSGDCYYCGAPPAQVECWSKRSGRPFVYNGIDRIDNTAGYSISNCVSSCFGCNLAKMKRNKEEFFKWVVSICRRHDLLHTNQEGEHGETSQA